MLGPSLSWLLIVQSEERKEKKMLRRQAFNIEKLEVILSWVQASLGFSLTSHTHQQEVLLMPPAV